MKLQIQHRGATRTVALKPGQTLRIGASAPAELIVGGEGVHPVHCGIVAKGGQLQVIPSKAAGKVLVNGAPHGPAILKPGDRVTVGDCVVTVVGDAPAPKQPASPAEDDFGLKPIGGRDLGLPALSALDEFSLPPLSALDDFSLPPLGGSGAGQAAGGLPELSAAELLPFASGPAYDAPLEELTEADLLPADVPSKQPPRHVRRQGGQAAPGGPKPPAKKPPVSAGQKPPDGQPAGTAPASAAAQQEAAGPPRKRSPLLWVGLVAAFLFVCGGAVGVYFMAFAGPSPDALLAEARQSFRGAQYAKAAEQYAAFLAAAPENPHAPAARQEADASRIIPLVDSADYSGAAQAYCEAAPKWGAAASADAQKALSDALPKLLGGLVQQAKSAGSDLGKLKAPLEQAQRVLAIAATRLPSLTDDAKWRELADQVASLDRQARERQVMAEAVAAIETAAQEGKVAQALAVREALVARSPRLARNSALRTALDRAAAAESELVRFQADERAGVTSERQQKFDVLATFVHRQGSSQDGGATWAAMVPELGVVYGLDAQSGKLKWRRAVGLDVTWQPVPVPIAGRPAGGFLLCDSRHGELLLVTADSGQLVWRQTLPALPLAPVVHQGRVLAACRNGHVVELELATGNLRGHFALSIPPAAAPVVDPGAGALYLAAEHSLLYVISVDSRTCKAAYYGHEAGSILQPPVRLDRQLAILESDGDDTKITLYAPETNQSTSPLTLPGRVRQTPALQGNRLYLATEDGRVHMVERQETGTRGLRRGFSGVLDDQPRTALAPRLLLVGERLFAATANGLSAWDVAADGKLNPAGTPAGHIMLGPPLLIDGHLLALGKSIAEAGYVALSWDPKSTVHPRWETRLGAEVVAAELRGTRLSAWTAAGDFYRLETSSSAGPLEQPLVRVPLRDVGAAGGAVRCGDVTIFVPPPGAADVILLDDGQSEPAIVPTPGEVEACQPLSEELAAVALAGGTLFALDVKSRQPRGEPFIAPFQAGLLDSWRLAPGPSAGEVYASRAGQLQLARWEGDKFTMQSRPVWQYLDGGSEAANGGGEQADSLERPSHERPSRGGLMIAGDLLLSASAGALHCFGKDFEPRWQTPPRLGPVCAAIQVDPDRLLAVAPDGKLWLLRASDGNVLGSGDAGEPLRGAPQMVDGKLIVFALDGSPLRANVPLDSLLPPPNK